MATRQLPEVLLDDLEPKLVDILSIQKAQSLAELLEAKDRVVFLRRPRIRVARQFDLSPDMLIHDGSLSTLGLVRIVDPAHAVATAVEGFVDQATQVRHLFLTQPDLEDRSPYSVELIIITPDHQETVERIGDALRGISRGFTYLEHVGINVLYHRGGSDPFQTDNVDADFRRELERRRSEAAELAYAELQGLMLKGVHVLGEAMEDANPQIRLRAAQTALSLGLRATELKEVERLLDVLDDALPLWARTQTVWSGGG